MTVEYDGLAVETYFVKGPYKDISFIEFQRRMLVKVNMVSWEWVEDEKLELANEENALELERHTNELQHVNEKLKEYKASKDKISSKYDALNDGNREMQNTPEEMKTPLQEALDKIRNKESEIAKLTNFNNDLCKTGCLTGAKYQTYSVNR